jgi:hypothetical protein
MAKKKVAETTGFRHYAVASITYSAVGLLGVFGAVYAFLEQKYFLLVICILIAYISSDVFFCGSRAKKAGLKTNSHYMMPPLGKKP